MKQLFKRFKQISIFILAITIIGCDNDDAGKLPVIIPGFTQTVNDGTGTVTFVNISENSSSYLWTFGDGTTSTEVNPIKNFGPGEYAVILEATNVAGATETFVANFTITDNEPEVEGGCTGTPEAATALPVDFEECETFLSSENFGSGLTSEIAENPSKTGSNTSDFVLKVDKPTDSEFFAGIQNTFASNFDLTTTDTFKVKVYSTKANVVFRFELALNPQTDPVTGNPAPVSKTIANANEWTEVEFSFTGLPGGPTAYNQLVIKPDNNETDDPITEGGTYYIDDLELTEGNTPPSDNLLINGDFEDGTTAWIGGGLNVVTEGGNSFNLVDVTVAGNPFDVNISQVLDLTQGENYILTFDASSDRARTILAGIGLNVDPFTNTNQAVNLTTETQTFTLNLSAADFGGVDSRVLFDMGAEVGTVVIDNVSLVLDDSEVDTVAPVISLNGDATVNLALGVSYTDAGATANDNVDGDISGSIIVGGDTVDTNTAGTYTITYNVSDAAQNAATQVTRTVVVGDSTFDDGLLTNGDFEDGTTAWIGGGLNVVTEGGNSFNLVDVTVAGNPFDVNISQVLDLTQGENYILTFDASSDRARTILAGIGLNVDPFTNTNQAVNLTTETQTFTLNLSAADFGGVDSRVLFDMGAEVGTVVIDNVSLVLDDSEVDTVAPVISLNGDATVNLALGVSYTDAGATANDNVDGDISGSIIVGGDTVDTNTAGTYTITYDVSDAATNAAAQVTRTVVVGATGGECLAETTQSLSAADFNLTFMSDPTASIIQDNTTFEYVDNPDFSIDPNMSCKVGKVTNLNVALWDNIQIDLANKLTFTSGSNFTMKIYSPQSGYKVTLKLEDKTNAGINTEVASASTTKTNEWEELTIPFGAGDSGIYDKIVIFFDLESQNGNTYYFDDLKLNGGTGVVDTEAPAAITDLTAANTTGLSTTLSWTTPNDNVGVTGYQVFRDGSSIATTGAATTYIATGLSPLTAYGFTVLAQDASGNVSEISNTVNITTLVDTSNGELITNGDFETGDATGWQFFDGASISSLVNNGGVYSAEIQGAALVARGIKQERFAVGNILPNTSYTVSFDITASEALGIGGLVKSFAFSEGADGGSVPATLHTITDNLAAISTTSWQTVTGTFTTPGNANQVEGGLSFLIEIVNSTAKINIDNVSIKITP